MRRHIGIIASMPLLLEHSLVRACAEINHPVVIIAADRADELRMQPEQIKVPAPTWTLDVLPAYKPSDLSAPRPKHHNKSGKGVRHRRRMQAASRRRNRK